MNAKQRRKKTRAVEAPLNELITDENSLRRLRRLRGRRSAMR